MKNTPVYPILAMWSTQNLRRRIEHFVSLEARNSSMARDISSGHFKSTPSKASANNSATGAQRAVKVRARQPLPAFLPQTAPLNESARDLSTFASIVHAASFLSLSKCQRNNPKDDFPVPYGPVNVNALSVILSTKAVWMRASALRTEGVITYPANPFLIERSLPRFTDLRNRRFISSS